MRSDSTATAVLAAPDECASSGGGITSSWAHTAALEFQATLQLLAERARFLTGANSVLIALKEGDRFVYAAGIGDSVPEVGSAADLAAGPIRQCVEQRKLAAISEETSSSLVVPVLAEESMTGFFQLWGRSKFEDRDEQAVTRLAELVPIAIDHKDAALRADSCRFEQVPELESAPPVRLWHAPAESEPSHPGTSDIEPMPLTKVETCATCGFPVSPGRRFCVDCEKNADPAPAAPVELFSSTDHESFLSAHGYTIASILVSALAIALILWLR